MSRGDITTSLKSASDIAKAMVDVRDANAMQVKVFELTRQIMSAQQNALATQSAQFALLNEVSDLKKEIARLEKWDSEKVRYELKDIYLGQFAHVLNTDRAGSEPPHWICTACYQNSKKNILQGHSIPTWSNGPGAHLAFSCWI